jgi:hypothetical protein
VTIERPSALTDIDEYGFSNCLQLKRISLPHAVQPLRRTAFYGCPSLQITFVDDSETPGMEPCDRVADVHSRRSSRCNTC